MSRNERTIKILACPPHSPASRICAGLGRNEGSRRGSLRVEGITAYSHSPVPVASLLGMPLTPVFLQNHSRSWPSKATGMPNPPVPHGGRPRPAGVGVGFCSVHLGRAPASHSRPFRGPAHQLAPGPLPPAAASLPPHLLCFLQFMKSRWGLSLVSVFLAAGRWKGICWGWGKGEGGGRGICRCFVAVQC